MPWVGFEATTTEFRSDTLTYWAIELLGDEFNSQSEPVLYSYSNFISWSVLDLISASIAAFIKSKFCWGKDMGVAEWTDRYGIHHWMIFTSSFRKLIWVGLEPTTTELRSDALTDLAIRPWV